MLFFVQHYAIGWILSGPFDSIHAAALQFSPSAIAKAGDAPRRRLLVMRHHFLLVVTGGAAERGDQLIQRPQM